MERGYEDPATFHVRNNGEPALLLGVVMREGWNGLDLGQALDREVGAINQAMPLGQSLDKVTDQAVNIRGAVDEFMVKFFVALLVVLVVCFVSMGWRVGLVVAAAVPLTLAAVFIVMAATGKNFDRITLGSLILALGLLVDDAIIAIEMMVVKMEQGYDRVQASAYAWSHTAAPMLSGTLVTAVGFMPNGFAKSTAGEYTSNMFWIVGIALIVSWLVAVVFTPYLGVKLLPEIAKVAGGHDAIYDTPRYNRFRRVLGGIVRRKWLTAAVVVGVFLLAGAGMAVVKKQFFPTSDRPEVLVEVQLPYGAAIERTAAATRKLEAWLAQQKEAKIVTSYIGQGAPRFYLAMSPELPDPSFAKIVIRTDSEAQREALKLRMRAAVAAGLAPEARVRVTQLVFGPYSPYPVAFRVAGPDPERLRAIAGQVEAIMRASPMLRTVSVDWGMRVPALHFALDQDRLQAVGLSSASVAQQLQLLLSGTPVTAVREDIRAVQVVARAAGDVRLDPARIGALTLVGAAGQRIPLSQVGRLEVRAEEPVLRRRDRVPTMTVRGDIDEALQPPDVSTKLQQQLQPVIAALPAGYRIDMAGSIEESGKANAALLPLFPIMLALTLLIIIFQVRSMAAMVMVLATSPLGLIGVVPTLLLFQQPFGINALVGLIALSGILMRNTLILIGQIEENLAAGLDGFNAVIEATVQRARPVILTALAAMLAFIPLTHSVFWGTLAYTLIGGTFAGTVVTLVFLPAMYAIWFRIKPPAQPRRAATGRGGGGRLMEASAMAGPLHDGGALALQWRIEHSNLFKEPHHAYTNQGLAPRRPRCRRAGGGRPRRRGVLRASGHARRPLRQPPARGRAHARLRWRHHLVQFGPPGCRQAQGQSGAGGFLDLFLHQLHPHLALPAGLGRQVPRQRAGGGGGAHARVQVRAGPVERERGGGPLPDRFSRGAGRQPDHLAALGQPVLARLLPGRWQGQHPLPPVRRGRLRQDGKGDPVPAGGKPRRARRRQPGHAGRPGRTDGARPGPAGLRRNLYRLRQGRQFQLRPAGA